MTPAIKPLPNETQPQFAVRYHSAMAGVMPDTLARNAAMFTAWDSARGDQDVLRRYAREQFPETQFREVRHVPVFEEHETAEGPDQTPVRYSRDDLVAIINRCNSRISDTNNFAPLSDGHTKPSGTHTEHQFPEVWGYSGPFYLGQTGRDKPRWAIFADEHHRLDRADDLKHKPFRSVEVWRAPEMADRFFSPIAALGSETPRLDMGMAAFYGRNELTGELVERYSGPVMPSATAVCVPSFGEKDKKQRYAADADGDAAPDSEENMAHGSSLSSEDIQALVAQIVPAVVAAVGEEYGLQPVAQAGDDNTTQGDPAGASPVEPEPDGDEAAPEIEPACEDGGPEQESPSPEKAPAPSAPAPAAAKADDPPTSEPAQPAGVDAGESANANDDDIGKAVKMRELTDKIAALEAENAKLREQVSKSSETAVQATRREQYSRLQQQGYRLDIDKEMAFAGTLSDDQFKAHLTRVAECYSRVPMAASTPAIPVDDSPPLARPVETSKSEQCSKKAVEHCRANPKIRYEEALELAKNGQI